MGAADTETMFTFTYWSTIYSRDGERRSQSWEAWRTFWTSHLSTKDKKTSLPCIVPSEMKAGGRRTNANVLTVEAIALDIERKDTKNYEARLEGALRRLEPYEYVAYTTYSHKATDPRIRILVPLARPVPPVEYKKLVSFLNCLTGSIADEKAQKPSQPVFVPAHKDGTTEEFWAVAHEGAFLDPDSPLVNEVYQIRLALGEGMGRAPYDNYLRQACKSVLLGRPYAEPGNRDETATRIAWHVSKTVRNPSAEAITRIFDWSSDEMGDDVPSFDNILSKVERGVEKRVEAAREEAENGVAQEAVYIVQKGGTYYFREQEGFSRPFDLKEAPSMVRKKLRQFPEVRLTTVSPNGSERQKTLERLVEDYGDIADSILLDTSAQQSFWDPEVLAFHEASVRWPKNLVPTHDPQIEEWLYMMGGEKLFDWLALFSDLSRLLSALVVLGPPNTGKTLLAMGCAARIGSEAPTRQRALTGQFQEELSRCPLVYIDEDIHDSPFDQSFLSVIRNEISVKERSVNRKYRAPAQMVGAIRCIISANHLPFRQKAASSGQDLKAIAERFLWVNTDKEVQEYLAEVPAEQKQDWRKRGIPEFIMHLEQTRRANLGAEHRFGVSGDAEALADLINIGVERNSWVTEWLCAGILDRFRKLQMGDPELRDGGVIYNGEAYVRVKTVARGWEVYLPRNRAAPDTQPISDALRSLSEEKTYRAPELGVGKDGRVRYYKIRTGPLIAWLEHTGVGTKEELLEALATNSTLKSKSNIVQMRDRT